MNSRWHSSILTLLLLLTASATEAVTVKFPYEYRNAFKFTNLLDQAIANLESAVTADPANVKLRFSLATLYYQRDLTQKAKQQFEAILKLRPDDADSYYHLGILSLEEGNVEEFKEYMEKTISLNPLHAEAYNSLVKMYARVKRLDEARRVLERGKKAMPREESFYFNEAILLMSHYKDERDKVISNMKTAIALTPKEEYFFILGWAHMDLKEYHAARAAMQKAFELNPKNVYALLAIATTYKEAKDYDKALELAEQARKIDPSNKDIEAEIQEYKDEWKESQKKK